jgi:hypothetical protein
MSVTRKYGAYAVSLGGTLLGGITRQNLVTGTQIRQDATSGEIYARFQALYSQRLAPGFSTKNVAAALTATGIIGGSISGMTGGMLLYLQPHVLGGTRGTTGRSFAFSNGILVPKQLTVSHRDDAVLTYDAVILSTDGQTVPVVITDAVALPAITSDAQRFTLGPVTINNTATTEVRSFTIDFGVDVMPESSDADIYDTFCSIRGQQTTLTLRGIDPWWLANTTGSAEGNLPVQGAASSQTTTKIYLTARAAGGTLVAGGTASHIMMTAAGLAHIDTAFDASGQEAAELNMSIPLIYDGTNAPLIITCAHTIP